MNNIRSETLVQTAVTQTMTHSNRNRKSNLGQTPVSPWLQFRWPWEDITTPQGWHHFLSLSKRGLRGTVYIMQIKVDYWHLLQLKNIQSKKYLKLLLKLLRTTSSPQWTVQAGVNVGAPALPVWNITASAQERRPACTSSTGKPKRALFLIGSSVELV